MALWKRLDQKLAFSKKHPALSDLAFRVWVHLLPYTDCEGRFSADPVIVKSQCLPRYRYTFEQIEEALKELERVNLIHRYESGSDRLLALHDCSDWNPGLLKYQKSQWPAPPEGGCRCQRRSNVVTTASSSPSSSSSGSSSGSSGGRGGEGGEGPPANGIGDPLHEHGPMIEPATQHLLGIAKKVTKMPNRRDTLAEYLEAGRHRFGAQVLEAWLYDDGNRGKDVKAMQDELEKLKKNGERLF